MSGGADAHAVGQDYGEMAASLDYICPMIYPSHYGDGYFGIAHPDTQPYQTIAAALNQSKQTLAWAKEMAERKKTAGTEEDEVNAAGAGKEVTILEEAAEEENENDVQEEQQVKEQIQAVYDAGYEEWILWDAKVTYHYDGLLLE